MKLSHFTKLFTQTILRRGKIYWKHGLVTIKEFDGQTYTATVKGTQNYTTTATLDGDEVVNISCTCPYGSRCKHEVALLYEIHARQKKGIKQKVTTEETEVEAPDYEPVDFHGLKLEAKEFFMLCALYFTGDSSEIRFISVPATVAKGWKFVKKERTRLLEALCQKDLALENPAYYFFEETTFEPKPELFFEVARRLIKDFGHWLDFFTEKLEPTDACRNLITLARELYGDGAPKRINIMTYSLQYGFGMKNVYLAIYYAMSRENMERMFAILQDDLLYPTLAVYVNKALTSENPEDLHLVRACLEQRNPRSERRQEMVSIAALVDYVLTGEWTELPADAQKLPSAYYMQGIRHLYEERLEESVHAFQKGLALNKGTGIWKFIPNNPIVFLCYTIALGKRRNPVDIQKLRKILTYKDEFDASHLSSTFVLVNFFQDNRQPKDGTALMRNLNAPQDSLGKQDCAIAALILHFFGMADGYNKPWPASRCAMLQRELSAYRIGQTQKVTVYHLIAEHTIEEKILRLHQTKQSLADSLLEGTDMSHKLTAKDLLELLG